MAEHIVHPFVSTDGLKSALLSIMYVGWLQRDKNGVASSDPLLNMPEEEFKRRAKMVLTCAHSDLKALLVSAP